MHLDLLVIFSFILCLLSGVCNCLADYGGDDCFVNRREAPNLFSIRNDGICDLRDENCDQISVFNNNTINTPELACFYTKLLVSAMIVLKILK